MQINLYATFRLLAGVRSFELNLAGVATLDEVVQAIVAMYPALRRHWLNDDGRLHAHVHTLVNGVDISTLPGGPDSPLKPGDVLDFFPPVAGGATAMV